MWLLLADHYAKLFLSTNCCECAFCRCPLQIVSFPRIPSCMGRSGSKISNTRTILTVSRASIQSCIGRSVLLWKETEVSWLLKGPLLFQLTSIQDTEKKCKHRTHVFTNTGSVTAVEIFEYNMNVCVTIGASQLMVEGSAFT